MPSSPASVKISARPRSGPVPNQPPIQSAPRPSVMNGMNTRSATGPMNIAVSGAAAFSTSWAKPKTRPWRSNGIDRCSTVCSAASMTGIISSQMNMPTASSTIDERSVNVAHTIQLTRLPASTMRTGRDPRPTLATTRPPTMNAELTTPNSIPHVSTDTSSSP